jgi:hypothetical protein
MRNTAAGSCENRIGMELVLRRSRFLVGFYFGAAFVFWAFAALFLLVAFGTAVAGGPWGDKIWMFAGWLVGGLSWAIGGIQMYSMGRAMAKDYVIVGEDGLRLRLPASDGDLVVPGAEFAIKWEDIEDVSRRHSWRENVCVIHTADRSITLTKKNCGDPAKVADMIAARKLSVSG